MMRIGRDLDSLGSFFSFVLEGSLYGVVPLRDCYLGFLGVMILYWDPNITNQLSAIEMNKCMLYGSIWLLYYEGVFCQV